MGTGSVPLTRDEIEDANQNRLVALQQEVAKVEYEFNDVQRKLNSVEWAEVVRRDTEAALLRRQNELQSYIYYAQQVISERDKVIEFSACFDCSTRDSCESEKECWRDYLESQKET